MKKGRARAMLCAALGLCLLGVVLPSGATALISNYNCPSKPNSQWCDGRANGSFDGLHSWNYNRGNFNNGGVTQICVHIWKPSTGGELGAECAFNDHVWQFEGNVQCACYEAEVIHFNFGGPLNLFGYADTERMYGGDQ
jgi:hypothetical protein